MSFFRNIRSTISRGKSSSRDTTPVRSSRPSSIIGSSQQSNGGRRDSLDSVADAQSVINRGETFILGEELQNGNTKSGNNSNCSTLEKKNKKSKVFSKFSTFTKRKKPQMGNGSGGASGLGGNDNDDENNYKLEHHPSDNATNTYYNWESDNGLAIDYDAQTDPFNFLYEQQSTLKALQQATASAHASRTNSFSSCSSPVLKTKPNLSPTLNEGPSQKTNGSASQKQRPSFDSSTYRKNSKSLSHYPITEQYDSLEPFKNYDYKIDLNDTAYYDQDEGPTAESSQASERAKEAENELKLEMSGPFDDRTYRKKSKKPSYLEGLDSHKDLSNLNDKEYTYYLDAEDQKPPLKPRKDKNKEKHNFYKDRESNDSDADKYKTITLNTLRKEFPNHYLDLPSSQRLDNLEEEPLEKPAWFVKVETKPPKYYKNSSSYNNNSNSNGNGSSTAKENRSDFFVFANENYRPGSRSPLREERSTSRSKTRSPIKRNETFKIDTPYYQQHHSPSTTKAKSAHKNKDSPSIQVAIRNSVRTTPPSTPIARIVPIGVAKPMPTPLSSGSPLANSYKARLSGSHKSPSRTLTPSRAAAAQVSKSPLRNRNLSNSSQNGGRFQTLVHINNQNNLPELSKPANSASSLLKVSQSPRLSTKVQLGAQQPAKPSSSSPSKPKTRFSHTNKIFSFGLDDELDHFHSHDHCHGHHHEPSGHSHFNSGSGLSSHMAPTISSVNKRQQTSLALGSGHLSTPALANRLTSPYQSQGRLTNSSLYLGHDHYSPGQPVSKLYNPSAYSYYQSEVPASSQALKSTGGLHQHHVHQPTAAPPAHKSRIMVSMQRRSRSPIKMPWR